MEENNRASRENLQLCSETIPKVGWEMVLNKVKIWAKAKHNPYQVSGISSGRVQQAPFPSFFSPLHMYNFSPLIFFRKPQMFP